MKHTGPRLSFFRCLFIWPLVTRPHTFRPYCDWLCSHTPKQWVNASYPALSRATLQRLHDSNHMGFSLGSILEAVLVVILTPKKTCQNQPYVLSLLVLLSTILQGGKKILRLSHLVRLSFPDTHWKSTEIGRFSGLLVIKSELFLSVSLCQPDTFDIDLKVEIWFKETECNRSRCAGV